MGEQSRARAIFDTVIIVGYSTFAFVVLPLLICAAWMGEQRSLSAEKA